MTTDKETLPFSEQFRDLDMQHPGKWPSAPKKTAYALIVVVMLALGWEFQLSGQVNTINAAMQEEDKLKQEYRDRIQQVTSLDVLRQQKKLVEEYVAVLEKQLPTKAEMEDLLSDINQTGLGRGLRFALFKPSPEVTKEFYVEQPVALRIMGNYHDIAAFASDIAELPRIVALSNLNMSIDNTPANRNTQAKKKNTAVQPLVLQGTIRTFRYLDKKAASPASGTPVPANGKEKG